MNQPPKILGLEMQEDGRGGWALRTGALQSKIFGVSPWLAATVGGAYVASSVDWPTAIAAIERELRAIRAAIPEQKEER